MYLQIVGIIIIITSCFLIGEILYNRLKNRLGILKQLHKIGRIYRGNIRYSVCDIEEILENIYIRVNEDVKGFISLIIKEIREKRQDNISVIWNKSVDINIKKWGLSSEELLLVQRFGETLGLFDKQMQIENVDLYLYDLDECINTLKKDIKVKNKMYKYISIISGIFIVLLIW